MFNLNNAPTDNDHTPNKSLEVSEPPRDSVSSRSFSPKDDFLVSTSWDNLVRCWQINLDRAAWRSGGGFICRAVGEISHQKPVLCSAWRDDGAAVFSGGCNNQVKIWDLASAGHPPITVGMHSAPVKGVAWIPVMNLLLTGSWDKTLKYWDLRQANAVHTQPLPNRFRAFSVSYPLMVVGAGERDLFIFDLQNPRVGSIEGRIAAQHIEDSDESKNFTFKCHRQGPQMVEIYSVNSLSFHPLYHTFSSTGSDGTCGFWDKDSKKKLQIFERCNQPIPCGTFSRDGSIFAYTSCYDWSNGAVNHNPATAKTYIFLHHPRENDLKAKSKTAMVAEKGTTSKGRFTVQVL